MQACPPRSPPRDRELDGGTGGYRPEPSPDNPFKGVRLRRDPAWLTRDPQRETPCDVHLMNAPTSKSPV